MGKEILEALHRLEIEALACECDPLGNITEDVNLVRTTLNKNDLILDLVKRFIKSGQQDIFDWCEEYDEINNTNITKLIDEWLKGE